MNSYFVNGIPISVFLRPPTRLIVARLVSNRISRVPSDRSRRSFVWWRTARSSVWCAECDRSGRTGRSRPGFRTASWRGRRSASASWSPGSRSARPRGTWGPATGRASHAAAPRRTVCHTVRHPRRCASPWSGSRCSRSSRREAASPLSRWDCICCD